LEVLGTRNLLNVLRTQLEAEGVGVRTTRPSQTYHYRAGAGAPFLRHRNPITKPSLIHDIRKLSDLDVAMLKPVFEREELAEVYRVRLKLEFATTETEIHQAEIGAAELALSQELLGSITNKVINRAKLPNKFAELYPAVKSYIATRCFGRKVDLDSNATRSNLSRLEIQEGIAKYLAREIAVLTVERRALEFERADYKLSETTPFSWRRNLPPPLIAKKTIFNYVATSLSAVSPSSSTTKPLTCCASQR
jgi:type III restriction enzyme